MIFNFLIETEIRVTIGDPDESMDKKNISPLNSSGTHRQRRTINEEEINEDGRRRPTGSRAC